MIKKKDWEQRVFQKGSELLEKSRARDSIFLEKNRQYKKMLSWAMRDKRLKTSLFRFIDVLPSLSDDRLFLSHFEEYFRDHKLGLFAGKLGRLAPGLMAKAAKRQIRQTAKIFIAGASVKEALPALAKNWKNNLAYSMDILGEATLSEKEAESYFSQYIHLMDSLLTARKSWPKQDLLEKDALGPVPAANISIKPSSLFSQIKTEAWECSKKSLKARLRPLFQKAVKDFVFINLDMERYIYKDLFLEIFKELIMEEDLKSYPHFGIVSQAYLRDSLEDLKQLSRFAEKRGERITVRLVKGAYWDSEILLARQKNWPLPVWTKIEETEANFSASLNWLFENPSNIKLAVGSHNIRQLAAALLWHEEKPELPLEFQFLYGMGEGLAGCLRDKGYCARLYCGAGELIPGMSYLVRRLLENSANQSFIFSSFIQNKSAAELLAPPPAKPAPAPPKKDSETSFKNHPLLDFSQKKNRDNFKKALEGWKSRFPEEVYIILEGQKLKSPKILTRENPSQTDQIVSRAFLADKEMAKRAVQSAASFFKSWRHSSPQSRISALKKLARLLREREFELSALQVFETGKSWREAQADVAEAIDFCSYYALSYESLVQKKRTAQVAGEDCFSYFEPIGPAVLIAPWNFPLAILTGMTVAPWLCGNPVLIKPAEQSLLTAYQLAKLMRESGFPEQSFAFLPGRGEDIGAYLAQHPQTPIVSFTGSFEVGAQIIKSAGQIKEGQTEIKKCVVEMGGKNAIVIDSSADFDEAVKGVLESAFGFQGQKCSAASRLIVLEGVYEKFMKRFLPAVESLATGPAEDPSSSLGPLIDEISFRRVKSFIQREKSQKLFEGSVKKADKSWLFPPHVYLAESAQQPLAQEELFAPVLAVFKARDLNEAIKLANQTRFGLTAGFYSRHPGHIKKFEALIEAGNIYINRACAGALVERHPFGGRKMSGLGGKTGGPEYLKQFLRPKTVAESSMRRGFAPELFEENFLKN